MHEKVILLVILGLLYLSLSQVLRYRVCRINDIKHNMCRRIFARFYDGQLVMT